MHVLLSISLTVNKTSNVSCFFHVQKGSKPFIPAEAVILQEELQTYSFIWMWLIAGRCSFKCKGGLKRAFFDFFSATATKDFLSYLILRQILPTSLHHPHTLHKSKQECTQRVSASVIMQANCINLQICFSFTNSSEDYLCSLLHRIPASKTL